MRLNLIPTASLLALAHFLPAQNTDMAPRVPAPVMNLSFADGKERLSLDALGSCKHFLFLAVGNRADTQLITAVPIMAQPIFIIPLAVYQAGQLGEAVSYPIVDHAALPPGVEIYLQGVAFPLADCGAARLTATDILRVQRPTADDGDATKGVK